MCKMTLGSLFDGSAGFPLGGMLCGITPVWASEIEPFPIRVTTKRIPFMTMSEGSEQARYTAIYMKLMAGAEVADDDE